MKLKINGELKKFDDNETLESVIKKLGVVDKVMAAAVNMEVVKKDKWRNWKLKDGDRVELLSFVGGG